MRTVRSRPCWQPERSGSHRSMRCDSISSRIVDASIAAGVAAYLFPSGCQGYFCPPRWVEFQRCHVDAGAQAARPRTIAKHMLKMGIARRAPHLGAVEEYGMVVVSPTAFPSTGE